ncbi:10008_t:CDS:2, partial [Gigaspora rosea]
FEVLADILDAGASSPKAVIEWLEFETSSIISDIGVSLEISISEEFEDSFSFLSSVFLAKA